MWDFTPDEKFKAPLKQAQYNVEEKLTLLGAEVGRFEWG